MHVPQWVTLAAAAFVIFFGLYRIRLATRSDVDLAKAGSLRGLYRMSRRTHALIGTVYLLLGAGLIATSFGWNPMAGMFGPDTETPTKANAPVKGGVPIDGLPAATPKKS